MNERSRWQSIRSWYVATPAGQKTLLLSLLAHQLTVCARGAYDQELEHSNRKLITMNELEHNITGELAHLIDGDEERYPDEVFLDIIWETATKGREEQDLLAAFEFAYSLVTATR